MQGLVGAAGEALGLTEDPLHTRVGIKVIQIKCENDHNQTVIFSFRLMKPHRRTWWWRTGTWTWRFVISSTPRREVLYKPWERLRKSRNIFPKDSAGYFHHSRLQLSQGKSQKEALLTLTVLEACVKNCGYGISMQINMFWPSWVSGKISFSLFARKNLQMNW